ncbi:MAG: acyl-CoA synthetase [Microbacterium sp.]
MTSASSARTFDVRHVQLARAAFAAIAAVMITFSPDHSAAVGLSVFSGFAIATGLVHLLSVWLVYPAGLRWPSVLLGIVTIVAGMAGGLGPTRTVTGFFVIVISWALVSGVIEAVSGILAVRTPRIKPGGVAPWSDGSAPVVMPRADARDAIVIGVVGVVLGLALLVIQPGYALQYSIEDANETFTLTGIIIAVGVFGGYAAIVAVYLGIAGFSPRQSPVEEPAPAATKDLA